MTRTIEGERKNWEKVAKQWGWHKEPFYVQVWIKNGVIQDSVSHRGLTKDLIINCKGNE